MGIDICQIPIVVTHTHPTSDLSIFSGTNFHTQAGTKQTHPCSRKCTSTAFRTCRGSGSNQLRRKLTPGGSSSRSRKYPYSYEGRTALKARGTKLSSSGDTWARLRADVFIACQYGLPRQALQKLSTKKGLSPKQED